MSSFSSLPWRRLLGVGLLALIAVIVVLWTLSFFTGSRSISLSRGLGETLSQDASDDFGGVAMAPSVESRSKMIAPDMMPIAPPVPAPGAPYADRQGVDQKIIRNASVSIRVDKAEEKFEQIKKLAEQYQGFVANAQLMDREGTKSGYLTLRIPNKRLDEALAAIKKLSLVVFDESSNASDVTAQYIDLEARLKTARAEETQYLEILKQARSVEDTLKVTAQLSEVRMHIEQMQTQLKYLTEQTDYSTLNVQLTEETKIHIPSRTWKPLETFKQAFAALIIALQSLVDFLITTVIFLIGFLLPVLLVLYFLYWIIRKIWRLWRRK